MHDAVVYYTCVKKVIGEEWQAKIQEHKKQSMMKAKKFGLLYAILMLTLTVSAQTGSISKIWLEHGVTENNSTGLRVHITVHTTGMKGVPARAIAYFDYDGFKDKALENERERAHYIEHRRNQLLGSKLGEVKDLFTGQFGIFERIKEKLIVAWATIWVCGEELGLWAWEEEDR